ncbi:MAG TPA: DegT/DnrJ/EryC1/StrS family aminotransferase [Methylovirgula sp.]|jgi:CDP-6-deoxy-D-xylo-4-hexulose-3-dehydrase
MFYELAASTWDHEEIEALNDVVASNRFTMGDRVREFEEQFAKHFGTKYAVMSNSGSSANLIATAALFFKKNRPLQRGDEAIVPALSWATTYHPLQQYGLKLKFVDIELDTLNIDVSQLERALTPKTRLIVAVSILGNPAALDVLRKFADKHGLYLLEDNCESMGAELNGKQAGTFGDIGTFSFFFSHHISTIEGGMSVTDSEELCHLMKALRAHGWTRDLPPDSPIFEKRSGDFFEAYRFVLPGYNVRSTEINAAIGMCQLRKLDGFVDKRRQNLALFQRLFKGDDRFIIQRENGKSSSFCFPIILNPAFNLNRERVLNALKDADIGHRIITGGNFLRHDVIRYYDYECVGEMTNANIAHDFGFFTGNHPYDLSKQIHKLRDVLNTACN